MTWKNINTAPKDGTPILLYLGEKPYHRKWVVPEAANNYAIGFWENGAWRSVEVEDCGTMGGELTGWMDDLVCIDVKPTHWMTLKPPGSAA